MEIVLSSASHHAILFAYLAKEAIDTFGEAGKAAVTAGVNRYGEQRGHRMALRTQADGNPLNVENYLVYGEWEAFPGQMDLRFPEYSPEVKMQNYRCPWHTEWSKRGLEEYGRYYCRDVDAALARGYNGMELTLNANRMMGDACCDFTFRGCSVPPERMEGFKRKQAKIGSKAKMPWEYHVGHIYRTMKEAIVDAFGTEGEAAVARALESYRQEYGDEARDLVLQYADVDYDAMPPYAGIESEG
ncbi:L-2-amino-thiazoline-4-carboxylic acid hydrolase [Flavonifractor sp. AGMB03687]|uniref:L-2-amino-thiazoline-4-carboxylic acid hydrolase n=1 Tax=Flavonifractor sp. AGMB03687 TaxID=2785133 RepID=UPI001ADFCF2A|nr:L-2-amino-thiazoline-4-carboxylic acid hydrolase [Flavonifractor sp. AGMB03687]